MSAPHIDNVTALQKPSASVVYITPEMAERWLGVNKVNRNIRNARVAQFARDMKQGRWQITGEAVKFGKSGNLLDGQHRCWAVVESGCTVPMFVIRGIEDDAQLVLDSGSARTAGDNLNMQGYKRATLVAAIARRRISMRAFNDVTNSEVYAFVSINPEIEEAALIASRYANRCDIIPTTCGLAAWKIAETHGWDGADAFFSAAAEKIGLAPSDPVLAMTSFFATERRNRRKLGLEVQMSVIIRAFNYRHQGLPWRAVRVMSPGAGGGVIPIPEVVE